MFELKTANKSVPLKWGTWAMKRFCDLKKLSLNEFFTYLSRGEFSISDTVLMLQSAAEYGYMKEKKPVDFDEVEICEWIDETGGLGEGGQIYNFFSHVVNNTINEATVPAAEKKSSRK